MWEISRIVKHPVLSKTDCCILGNINNVFFDGNCKKIAYFVLSNEQASFALSFSDVICFSDAIVIESKANLLPISDLILTEFEKSTLGKIVYSNCGKLIGTVDDVVFNDKGKVVGIIVGGASLLPSNFYAFGDILLVKDGIATKCMPRPRFAKDVEDRVVTILPVLDFEASREAETVDSFYDSLDFDTPDAPAAPTRTAKLAQNSFKKSTPTSANDPMSADQTGCAQNSATAPMPDDQNDTTQNSSTEPTPSRRMTPHTVVAEPAAEIAQVLMRDAIKNDAPPISPLDIEDHNPPRIISDYNFLLGRTLACDLKNYLGEVIAPRFTIITVDVVEKARKYGKMLDLTLNSK